MWEFTALTYLPDVHVHTPICGHLSWTAVHRYWFFGGIMLLSSIWTPSPPLCPLRWVPTQGGRLSNMAPLKTHIPWFAVILPAKGLSPWDPLPRRNQLSQVSRTPFHPFPAGLCFKKTSLWSAVKGVTRFHSIIAAQDLDSHDCYNFENFFFNALNQIMKNNSKI